MAVVFNPMVWRYIVHYTKASTQHAKKKDFSITILRNQNRRYTKMSMTARAKYS